MKKTNGLIMALVAGTAASLASAQTEIAPVTAERSVQPVSMTSNGVDFPLGGFGSRAPVGVYDQWGVQVAFGTHHLMDDVSFVNSPYNAITGRMLNTVDLAWQLTGANSLQTYIIVRVWDEDDVNPFGWTGTGTSMINPAAVPLGTATYNFGVIATGFAYTSTGLALGAGIPVPDDDNGVFVELTFSQDGTTISPTVPATGFGFHGGTSTNAVDPGNPALVGTTTRNYYRDRNTNGTFEGNVVAAANEHTFFLANTNQSSGVRFRLGGDIPVTQPTCTPLGNLADGTTPANSTVAAGGVNWFCFNLNGEAVDASKTFLDIVSQSSSSADVAIGIFDPDGVLIVADDNDGDGNNAQASFGLGIRAGQGGDSLNFDGRDGELPFGQYFIAVTSSPATFLNGFAVTSTGAGGSADVSISTNANTAAAFAEVPPIIPAGNDLGILAGPVPGAEFTPNVGNNELIGWYKFQTCEAAAPGSFFVDIDGSASDSITDSEFFLFDSNGNLVATNDDADADGVAPFYLKSHLSFGNVGPRPTYGTDPLEAQYTGENGTLPAGTYYLAVAFWNAIEQADAATDGNFHIRGTSGDAIGITPDFYTDITTSVCGGGGCPWETFGCTADQDGDDDVDSDDIVVFFANFENGDTCGDQDGDEDVDSDDIVIFFGLFEQGGC